MGWMTEQVRAWLDFVDGLVKALLVSLQVCWSPPNSVNGAMFVVHRNVDMPRSFIREKLIPIMRTQGISPAAPSLPPKLHHESVRYHESTAMC